MRMFVIIGVVVVLLIGVGERPTDGGHSVKAQSGSSMSRTTVIPPDLKNWIISTEKSKIDDSENVYMYVTSRDAVRDKFERMYFPKLWIACRENTTSLVVNFDGMFMADIQGYGDVIYRIDKQPAGTIAMTESTSSEALGLWSGGGSIPFIKRLLERFLS
jgi:type VI secretion system protein VasI